MSDDKKLWDYALEVKALKSVLNGGTFADRMFASLKDKHFHGAGNLLIFKRLSVLMEKQLSTLPSWRVLLSDAALESSITPHTLDDFETSPEVTNEGDFELVSTSLVELFKRRAIYKTLFQTQDTLFAKEKSANDIASEVSSALVEMDTEDVNTEICIGAGYNNLANQIFHSILDDSSDGIWLPSGYKSFDTQSRGFQAGDLVCLGANTGGGKCTDYNTLVPTSEGVLAIGDLHAEFGGVASGWSPASKKILVYTTEGHRPIEGFFRSTSKTLEVTSNWGDVFRGTPEHRLLCLDNDALKYKHMSEIKEGDWLPKSVGTQMYGAEDLPLDISEGFGKQASTDKCVPSAILKAGKQTQAAFIRGLFGGNLELYSSSKTFIYQVKGLLDNMGILCSIMAAKVGYSLSINRDLYETIPAEAIKKYVRRLRELSEALGEGQELDSRNWCSRYLAEKILSIHLEDHVHPVLREKIAQDEILTTLGTVVREQLSHVWMQVSKIVIHNEETPVYDLSIQGKREYSASGFMSHNSQMALNLMTRAYLSGFEVVMASYEMTYEQIITRKLSIISELPHDRIRAKSLSPNEKKFLEWAWYDYNLKGKRQGNDFWLSCPTSHSTVFEVGFRYKAKKPMAMIFDYINLLKTNSKHGEAQWMMLGEIAKEGKMLARRLNCVVILLVQIDKEHNFRYSQAIKDHADWIWGWVYDEEAKTNGFVTIKQIKTRSAPSYDFQLVTRFDLSQFRDPEEEDRRFEFTDEKYRLTIEEAKDLKIYGRSFEDKFATPSPIVTQAAPALQLVPRTTPPRAYNLD